MIFGCIGRIVVAFVLLIAGAVLWHFREAWVPQVKEFFERKAKEVELPVPAVGGSDRAPRFLATASYRIAPGVSAVWA